MNKALKLTIELVPNSAWFQNYRNAHPVEWNRIRRQCYADANHTCEACGRISYKRLEAHEVWEWEGNTQRLVRLQALCPDCHEVKHFGLAQSKGRGQQALSHFMNVNNMNTADAIRYINTAFRVWRQRSQKKWNMDCSILEEGSG